MHVAHFGQLATSHAMRARCFGPRSEINQNASVRFTSSLGQLAQLVRAFARHAKGHRFEPCTAHQKNPRTVDFFHAKVYAVPQV